MQVGLIEVGTRLCRGCSVGLIVEEHDRRTRCACKHGRRLVDGGRHEHNMLHTLGHMVGDGCCHDALWLIDGEVVPVVDVLVGRRGGHGDRLLLASASGVGHIQIGYGVFIVTIIIAAEAVAADHIFSVGCEGELLLESHLWPAEGDRVLRVVKGEAKVKVTLAASLDNLDYLLAVDCHLTLSPQGIEVGQIEVYQVAARKQLVVFVRRVVHKGFIRRLVVLDPLLIAERAFAKETLQAESGKLGVWLYHAPLCTGIFLHPQLVFPGIPVRLARVIHAIGILHMCREGIGLALIHGKRIVEGCLHIFPVTLHPQHHAIAQVFLALKDVEVARFYLLLHILGTVRHGLDARAVVGEHSLEETQLEAFLAVQVLHAHGGMSCAIVLEHHSPTVGEIGGKGRIGQPVVHFVSVLVGMHLTIILIAYGHAEHSRAGGPASVRIRIVIALAQEGLVVKRYGHRGIVLAFHRHCKMQIGILVALLVCDGDLGLVGSHLPCIKSLVLAAWH